MPLLAISILLTRLWRSVASAWRDPETRGLVYLTLIIIGLGTVFYRMVEGWEWLDALYFSVITLATVGYGDFAPVTNGGKLFTILYILVGLGIIARFITLIAQMRREDIRKHKGLKTAERVDDESRQDSTDEV